MSEQLILEGKDNEVVSLIDECETLDNELLANVAKYRDIVETAKKKINKVPHIAPGLPTLKQSVLTLPTIEGNIVQ